MGKSENNMKPLKLKLSARLLTNDVKEVSCKLSMMSVWTQQLTTLCKKYYIETVLPEARLSEFRAIRISCDTLVQVSTKCKERDDELSHSQKLIRSLLYIARI